MKKLSILIPHYNCPQTLEILLNTIPFQPEVEVIVCDDRSTKALEEYQALIDRHPDVVFIRNTSSFKGAGASRNLLIEKAAGTFILFADADDYFETGFLDHVLPYLDSEKDLVFFSSRSVFINTQTDAHRTDVYNDLIKQALIQPNQTNTDRLRFQNPVPWAKLIRRSILIDHQIRFEPIRASEDVMFSIAMGLHAQTVAVDPQVIYVVTRSAGSLTASQSEASFDLQFEILIKRVNTLRNALSAERFEALRFPSAFFILTAVKRHYPLKKSWSMIKTMRQNKIRILPKGFYRPSVFLKTMKAHRTENKAAASSRKP